MTTFIVIIIAILIIGTIASLLERKNYKHALSLNFTYCPKTADLEDGEYIADVVALKYTNVEIECHTKSHNNINHCTVFFYSNDNTQIHDAANCYYHILRQKPFLISSTTPETCILQ